MSTEPLRRILRDGIKKKPDPPTVWVLLGLYWDNGNENGSYYLIKGFGFRV